MYNLIVFFHVSADVKDEVTTAMQNDEEWSPSVNMPHKNQTQLYMWSELFMHDYTYDLFLLIRKVLLLYSWYIFFCITKVWSHKAEFYQKSVHSINLTRKDSHVYIRERKANKTQPNAKEWSMYWHGSSPTYKKSLKAPGGN